MTIRKKALLVIGAGSAFIIAVFILSASYFLINQSIQIEDKNAKLDLGRVNEAIISRYQGLDGKLSDWSSWDDTYKFIKDKNKAYIKSNVESDVIFTQFKLNLMIYLDTNTNIILEKGYDYKNNHQTSVPKSIYSHLTADSYIIKEAIQKGTSNGILILPEGPIFIAARPILTSENIGPSRGTLIFARYFDATEIKYIESVTKHEKIHFYLANDPTLPEDEAKNLTEIINNESIVYKNSSKEMEGFQVIRDVYNNPSLFFGLYLPRDIYQQSLNSVHFFTVLIGFVSIIFLLCTNFIFGKLILDPLSNVINGVAAISNHGDFEIRLKESGRDEITDLSRNINFMLNAIDEMKRNAVSREKKLEETNKNLEDGKIAMFNILEDEKSLEEDLKKEKKSIEAKVVKRTRELTEEKSKLLASIEALVKAYVMIDAKSNIILTNHNLSELFGNVEGNKWTLNLLQSKLGNSFDLVGNYKKCLITKKRIIFEDQAFGTKFLEIRISPVFKSRVQSSVIGVLIIIGDVTEEKVLERSKDEFFSIASHELRTPLTAIRGNTSMMLDYYKDVFKDPELKQMLLDTHDASTRLIGIVNDFLDLSRLEQKRMKYNISSFELNNIIESVLGDLKETAGQKNIVLESSVKAGIKIKADPDKLKEVIFNLVGNSIKFTEKGSISVSALLESSFVKISISDTGMGIPLGNQSLLFRKFQQAGESTMTRDSAKGTGLGLYISKLMVEGMGGSIYLEKSVVGKGSTFTFTLPTV